MEEAIKQCVGIDISKATFTACVCQKFADGRIRLSPVESFDNGKTGFNQLVKWGRKLGAPQLELLFLMEATGCYFEPLAYHLHRLNQPVSVILPNKVKHYGKSLNVKTKTDAVDARVIAQLGAERHLPLWEPPQPIFRQLRGVTRLRADLVRERTAFQNRITSGESAESVERQVSRGLKAVVKELDRQIDRCDQELEKLVQKEDWLWQKMTKLQSIKGIGLLTVATVVAETQGFALVKSRKQLASYAGYDVVQRDSGTSVKGKTKISKKGNSRIRAALHMPARSAALHSKSMREFYLRVNEGKPSKRVGEVAVARKLLLLMYTLWKKDEAYQKTTFGNQEAKPLLRQGEESEKKVGSPTELPTQDGLSYNQSAEVLLRRP